MAEPIDFAAIDPETLNQEHPRRRRWKHTWENHRLLYVGGEEFLSAAGQAVPARFDAQSLAGGAVAAILSTPGIGKRWRRFLYQLDGEPDPKYFNRWQRAVYLNYFAAIIDYHRHYLYSAEPQVRPAANADTKKTAEAPKWSADFIANCTGGGKGLVDFCKDEFKDVLLNGYAGHLLGRADADVGAISADNDGDRVVLTPYNAPEILDWQMDASGELEWVLLEKRRDVREFPAERVEVTIRTYVDRIQWAAWECVRGGEGERDTARLIDTARHDLGRVPFVWHEVPEGLWMGNKLATWQVNLFNQLSMLEYGALMSCYLQPAHTKPVSGGAQNQIYGESNLLNLWVHDREGGAPITEKFEWISPNPAPLEFQQKRIGELKDEGYRIVHQMSLAVDSQAVTAIARSGQSKMEDRRATEVILCGFGSYERDVIKRTMDLCSLIYGDKTQWSVEGFDNFNVSTLDEELTLAGLVQTLDVKSKTFKAELQKQVATGRVLPHLDEGKKQIIRDEIDAAHEEADEMPIQPGVKLGPDGKPLPMPPGMQPMGDDDEKAEGNTPDDDVKAEDKDENGEPVPRR
jgi:hypothetical protein